MNSAAKSTSYSSRDLHLAPNTLILQPPATLALGNLMLLLNFVGTLTHVKYIHTDTDACEHIVTSK